MVIKLLQQIIMVSKTIPVPTSFNLFRILKDENKNAE